MFVNAGARARDGWVRARERGTVLHGPDDEAAEGDEEDSKQPDVEGEGHENVAHTAKHAHASSSICINARYHESYHEVPFVDVSSIHFQQMRNTVPQRAITRIHAHCRRRQQQCCRHKTITANFL